MMNCIMRQHQVLKSEVASHTIHQHLHDYTNGLSAADYVTLKDEKNNNIDLYQDFKKSDYRFCKGFFSCSIFIPLIKSLFIL